MAGKGGGDNLYQIILVLKPIYLTYQQRIAGREPLWISNRITSFGVVIFETGLVLGLQDICVVRSDRPQNEIRDGAKMEELPKEETSFLRNKYIG